MAAQETQSDKSKLDAAKVPATTSEDATSYVGTPAVGTSKAVAAAGLRVSARATTRSTSNGGAWRGAPSVLFLAPGS